MATRETKSGQKKPAGPTGKRRSSARKPRTDTPKGARLGAAQQSLRDDLMMARLASDWTWAEIAEEAGISVSAAKKAVTVRRAQMPMRLAHDPLKIVETAMEGFVASVASMEAIAVEAARDRNWAAAVGAKKGANDARTKVLALLQATGRLPQELGALRHLIDLRAIAIRMLNALDTFERAMALLNVEEETRTAIEAGVADVRGTFHDLIGIDESDEDAQKVIEGTAEEVSG